MSAPTTTPTSAETFFENLGSSIKDSLDRLQTMMRQGATDVQQMTVETKDTNNNLLYRTIVTIDGGVSNQFPTLKPDANDEYWKRHNAVVDQVIQNRTQLMIGAIQAVGSVLKIPI